jgi:glycerophosphoryl diester phosphodiesterase
MSGVARAPSRGRRLRDPRWPVAPGWLREPLAHRGLHTPDGPAENTLEAFAAARAAGFGVELDVRLTVNGVAVVHHDPRLPGAASVARPSIATTPAADLPEDVPTLEAALEVLGTTPVMVELKQQGLRAAPLTRVVVPLLDRHRGPLCVASFHPVSVAWFARHRPDLVRVMTVSDQPDFPASDGVRRRLASLRYLRLVRPHAVSFDVRDLPHPASVRWRDEGGVLVTWTVRDAATLAVARAHADGIIFEHVDPRLGHDG